MHLVERIGELNTACTTPEIQWFGFKPVLHCIPMQLFSGGSCSSGKTKQTNKLNCGCSEDRGLNGWPDPERVLVACRLCRVWKRDMGLLRMDKDASRALAGDIYSQLGGLLK